LTDDLLQRFKINVVLRVSGHRIGGRVRRATGRADRPVVSPDPVD
jgi:hypothetical protein